MNSLPVHDTWSLFLVNCCVKLNCSGIFKKQMNFTIWVISLSKVNVLDFRRDCISNGFFEVIQYSPIIMDLNDPADICSTIHVTITKSIFIWFEFTVSDLWILFFTVHFLYHQVYCPLQNVGIKRYLISIDFATINYSLLM